MKWKNLPSWLKGGMIVSSISFILLIIYYLYFEFMMVIFGEIIFYVLYPIITLAILGAEMCGQECPSEITSIFLIVMFALINIGVHFLIGAIIGWLYGKFKKSKGKIKR